MVTMWVYPMCLLFLVSLTSAKFHLDWTINPNAVKTIKDWVYLSNCGDSKHDFTIRWSPPQVKPDDTVTLDVSYVARETTSKVRVEGIIWAKGIEEPILEKNLTYSCKDMKGYKTVKCPVSPNEEVGLHGFQVHVPKRFPAPPGPYIIRAKIFNQDGTQVVCAKGNIQILPGPPINWDDY